MTKNEYSDLSRILNKLSDQVRGFGERIEKSEAITRQLVAVTGKVLEEIHDRQHLAERQGAYDRDTSKKHFDMLMCAIRASMSGQEKMQVKLDDLDQDMVRAIERDAILLDGIADAISATERHTESLNCALNQMGTQRMAELLEQARIREARALVDADFAAVVAAEDAEIEGLFADAPAEPAEQEAAKTFVPWDFLVGRGSRLMSDDATDDSDAMPTLADISRLEAMLGECDALISSLRATRH